MKNFVTVLSLFCLLGSASSFGQTNQGIGIDSKALLEREKTKNEARDTLSQIDSQGYSTLQKIQELCSIVVTNSAKGRTGVDVLWAVDRSLCQEDVAILLSKYAKGK